MKKPEPVIFLNKTTSTHCGLLWGGARVYDSFDHKDIKSHESGYHLWFPSMAPSFILNKLTGYDINRIESLK